MEGSKLGKFLHAVRGWQIHEDYPSAKDEADDMERQYHFFVVLKTSASSSQRAYYEAQCGLARRQMMDANSYAVSLRRRGYDLALDDFNTNAEEVEHRALSMQGPQLSMLANRPEAPMRENRSDYSSLNSR